MKKRQISKRKRTATTTTSIPNITTPTPAITTTATMPPCLPHEIIFFHILPKLPACCLYRSSCVSKLWYNTIHDPKFIATHLRHAKSNPSPLALLTFGQSCLRFLHLEKVEEEGAGGHHHHHYPDLNNNNNNIASLDLRLARLSAISVVGYCNGLTCNACSFAIHISNPSTRELLTFSQPRLSPLTRSLTNHDGTRRHGFGFDPVMNEYKVIQICFNYTSEFYECWVYTLGTNLWRNITATCNYVPSCFPNDLTPICVSGALYWIAGKFGRMILSFDLHREQFQLVPRPQVPRPASGLKCYGLFELAGCPSLLYRHDDNLIKDGVQLILYALTNHYHHRLRVMHTKQQQASSSTWIRVGNCIRLPFKPDTEIIRIVAISKQIYLQWNTRDGDFIWYNVNRKIIQKKLSGLSMCQRVVLVKHVENLLSLKTFVPPYSAAGEFKVKYVSSRKGKHESPIATSCCSDQLRQQRKKKRRRSVYPYWFPIIF